MHAIRQYLLTLCAASVVCAVINTLFDSKGSITKIIRLLTGMFIALCAFSPLVRIDKLDFTTFTDRIHLSSPAVEMGKSMAENSTAELIKESVAAYVLDKAAQMDLNVDVEVILDNSEPPQVCEIILKGDVSPYAKEILGQYISDTLGVAKEDQSWK